MEKIEQRLKEIKEEKIALEEKIENLNEEKDRLKKDLRIENTTHQNIDAFPDEMKELEIEIPDKFRLYNNDSPSVYAFYLDYDNHKFYILHRLDEAYPYSFKIDGYYNHTPDLPILVQIYYKNPYQIITAESLRCGELHDLVTALNKAKEVLKDKWTDSLAFGIAIYYYWITMYYQSERYCKLYKNLYAIFEKDMR